jgi:hypothetical protein
VSTETSIRQALEDLLATPEPADLAERALRGAARRRALRRGSLAAAGVAVVALAAAAVWNLPGGPRAAPGSRPASAPCVMYTSGSNGQVDVPRAQWPDIVSEAIAALPDRSDYSMQSGQAWCGFGTDAFQAYAVINLGVNREAGELTLTVIVNPQGDPPSDCTEAVPEPDLPWTLLFCDEATGATTLTFGVGSEGYARVTAIYPGSVVVEMESYGPITAEQLRTAVQDPYVYAAIPLQGGSPT